MFLCCAKRHEAAHDSTESDGATHDASERGRAYQDPPKSDGAAHKAT